MPTEPLRSPAPPLRLILTGLAAWAGFTLLAWAGIELSRQPGSVATLWFANMAGAGWLIQRPLRQWPWLMLCLMLANLTANVASGDSVLIALAFLPANAVEIGLIGWLLLRHDPAAAMTSPLALLRALALIGVVPALVGASVGALTLDWVGVAPFMPLWPRWLEGDLIGALSVLPLMMALSHPERRKLWRRLRSLEAGSLLLLTGGVALVVPVTLPFPFVYLSLPLVLIALTHGFVLTAVANLLMTVMLGTLIGLGLLPPPATTREWEHVLLYLPILAAILPPILLAAAMDGYRQGIRELKHQKARLRTLYNSTPALLLSFDLRGHVISVSDLWLQKLGRLADEVLHKPFWQSMTPASAQTMQNEVWPKLLQEEGCSSIPCQWQTLDGPTVEGLLSAIWERDGNGQPWRALAVIEDVTETRRLADFAAEREFIEVTMHSIGDGVVATDAQARIHYINPVAETLLGWTRSEAQGRPLDEVVTLLDQNTQLPIPNPMHRCLKELRSEGLTDTTVLLGRDGQQHPIQDSVAPILGRQGRLLGAVMVFQDVREARALTRRMAHLAQHDALTDLPNRVLLQDRIQQACEHAQRHHGTFGVMFLDLDHFKQINDNLGHAAGDDLLRLVSQRLRRALRASDTICRLGGDEFVMLVQDIDGAADLALVAEKVLADVARPCQVAGQEQQISVSLGVAVYPQDGTEVEALMKHADAAMYRAKRDGRNRYHFFSLAMDKATQRRQQHEEVLSAALRERRVGLRAHPVVALDNGTITAIWAEPLWQPDPTGPWLALPPPDHPADESGLVVPLEEALIAQACEQLRHWLDAGLPPRHLALPISPTLLGATGVTRRIHQSLLHHRVAPGLLELVLPEGALHALPSIGRQVLGELHASGVRLSVREFGGGAACLNDLATHPLYGATLASELIDALPQQMAKGRLMQALTAGAHTLGLHVTAPGVASTAQLAWLRATPGLQAHGPAVDALVSGLSAEQWLARAALDLPTPPRDPLK